MIQELESLVRAGQLDEAMKRLREINTRKVPRGEALAYANLARRLGLSKLSVKILNPIVRAERTMAVPATADEKIEYAASLRNLGAVPEAAEMLAELDVRKHPQAAFQRAICLIHEWRYQSAIPLLQSYIRNFRVPSYAIYVAKVNLLEALIYEDRLDDASILIEEFRNDLDLRKFPLIYRKGLELAAQLELAWEHWDQAIRHLEEAGMLLPRSEASIHSLLVRKWLAVARSLRAGKVSQDLLEAKKQAIACETWETARDCEFHIARISHDDETLVRLYFGTPFEGFRRKVLKCLQPKTALPERFLWSGDVPSPSGAVMDLVRARDGNGRAILSPGRTLHRFLIVLSQDFYKPVPLLSAFSKLFPEEQFNPATSPNRVHQIILRFRSWCQSSGLPLGLEEISGSYRLGFNGRFSIAVPREPLPLSERELQLLRLRSYLDQGAFTTKDASHALGLSKTVIKELLKWAIEAGKVEREGLTHRARYRWKS